MKTKAHLQKLILTFILCCVYSNICLANSPFDAIKFGPYNPVKEGAFVVVPAEVGGIIGYVIAVPTFMMIGLPVAYCSDSGSRDVERIIMYSTIWPLNALFGAPSYLIKKTFWDGPQEIHSYFKEPTTNSTKKKNNSYNQGVENP